MFILKMDLDLFFSLQKSLLKNIQSFYKMKKCIVTIPIYKKRLNDFEKISFFQCCKILKNYDFSIVSPAGLNLDEYVNILDSFKINCTIEYFKSSFFESVASYNLLMLDANFYRRFDKYDFILVYQLDAYVFDDQLEYWCNQGYDYVGAPWFDGYGLANDKSSLIRYSGNGGFSLRSVKSFLRVLTANGKSEKLIKEFVKTGNNEDGFFSFHAKRIISDFSVAPADVAMFFSFECLPEKLYVMTEKKLPFGCHAWGKYNLKFWSSFIDIKKIYTENKIKFSIIICTYNTDNRLPKTLDSILAQSNQNFEVIIIDGASSDGTVDIIRRYEGKFAGKLRWISEKDTGIYNAINKGVKMAKGEYLNVVGAGDWLEKNALEKADECTDRNPNADAVHGKLRVWDKNLKHNYLLQTFPDMLAGNPMQHPALYYKKELHNAYGSYNEEYKIVSDYFFCIKAFFVGSAIAIAFDSVVDNYVTNGISSINLDQCENESMLIRQELKLNPMVSVIVPAYNQGRYIAETIKSIIAQKYLNWECIIIDDGSTDNTEIVAMGIIDGDKRFKYIKQKNRGLSTARNNGILQSQGEFLLPLDSDDLISPLYIQDAVGIFLRNPETKLVYCEAEYFGERVGKWQLLEYSYERMLFANMIFCSAIYRREDYDKTNGYNANMKSGLEDWDFWLSFLEEDDIVFRIPKIHFYYRIKKNSMNVDLYKKDDKVKLMYKQIYLNHEVKYRNIINPIYTEKCLNELRQIINNTENNKDHKRINFLSIDIIEKTYFIIFSPRKYFIKYFNKLLGSILRQPIRRFWYAIRLKKIK